jgi:hypothetical protein
MAEKNKIEINDVGHFMLADGEWSKFIINDLVGWVKSHLD